MQDGPASTWKADEMRKRVKWMTLTWEAREGMMQPLWTLECLHTRTNNEKFWLIGPPASCDPFTLPSTTAENNGETVLLHRHENYNNKQTGPVSYLFFHISSIQRTSFKYYRCCNYLFFFLCDVIPDSFFSCYLHVSTLVWLFAEIQKAIGAIFHTYCYNNGKGYQRKVFKMLLLPYYFAGSKNSHWRTQQHQNVF